MDRTPLQRERSVNPAASRDRCGAAAKLALRDLEKILTATLTGMTAMNRRHTAAWVVAAAFGLGVASAHAGPCSSEIAQFEQAVRQSAGNPNAGPMAPQSIGAQLDRQPTPGSIKRAEQRAQATFAATLARAKRLDARGDRAGCTRALGAAKRMYNF
jgi:hypothetical protein